MDGQDRMTDSLLKSVADAKSQLAITRAQRGVVVAACNYCRAKKVKCDAGRPCSTCVRSSQACQYDTQGGETQSQATKRKHGEMSRSHDTYAELFHLLANSNGRQAAELYHQIRTGRDLHDIVSFAREDQFVPASSQWTHDAQRVFLITLAHSTGSSLDIIKLAMSAMDPFPRHQLPDTRDMLGFRNQIAHIQRLEATVLGSVPVDPVVSPLSVGLSGGSSARLVPSAPSTYHEFVTRALHAVPAQPWTSITTSDSAVSHLVSTFLAWINPTWRFVEQDLFLQGMRSGDKQSIFCSPLLVNSICAIACLQSEHDVAFACGGGERISRGEAFHNQALQLWASETNRTGLANIQALCILSLDSNYRAKDKQGLSLIPLAIQLDNELHFSREDVWYAKKDVSKQDYARARLATHWTAINTHINMRIAFMSDMTVKPTVTNPPKIHETFPNFVDPWIGYPLSREAVPHSPTIYLRERCRLSRLFSKMHDLIFADQRSGTDIREFITGVEQLTADMELWHARLPFELQYGWPMCVAVWELHASYLAFSMVLRLVARNRCLQDQEQASESANSLEGSDAVSGMSRSAHDNLSKALSLAYKAAQALRDFRERYGLKITPAWLLQMQAVAASVLVLDTALRAPSLPTAEPSVDPYQRPIADSHTALDEVFRCLIGTGVETTIARGVARMIYHTALEQKIVLSQHTKSMLMIMAETSWQPSDLRFFHSRFPDFTTARGDDRDGESRRLTELLSQWETLDI